MPRITGPTIAAHVAEQEAAVVRAAVRLFTERGFTAVTLGDIADEVGLARTSLYRYFPDKEHILLAWFRTEMAALIERSESTAVSDDPAAERLRRWLQLQLDSVAERDHQLFASLSSSIGALSPEVRAEIGEEHLRLYESVEAIVADALAETGQGDRDPALVAGLVVGLVRTATEQITGGMDATAVGRELRRGATAVVGIAG